MKLAYLLVTASILVGCGGDKKPAESPNAAATATTSAAPAPSPDKHDAVGSSLTVSDEIYRLCHLQQQSAMDATPKFAFDATLITKADALVLDQIAACLTTGPLANRKVQLTGRADPRGTEEYNMSLGARRANAVSSYLQQHKVSSANVGETSRGSLDATGTDEETWAKDRRVDIALQN